MTGRIGTIDGQELWLRCPFCGDSNHDPQKCHLSIHLGKWLYYCHRCGAGGKLSTKEMLTILESPGVGDILGNILSEDGLEEVDESFPELIPGAGNLRPSLLQRFHIRRGTNTWDAFQIRDSHTNQLIGIHTRVKDMKVTIGSTGADWVDRGRLVSFSHDPLIIVEGPYDVVMPKGVCVFGLLSESSLKQFYGHYAMLCPDGDVWEDAALMKRFLVTLSRIVRKPRNPWVTGVIKIPDGQDPDTGWNDREVFTIDEALEFVSRHFGSSDTGVAKEDEKGE